MLDETTSAPDPVEQERSSDQQKVTCFVCKREVDRVQARQAYHSREKEVWVCETHIK